MRLDERHGDENDHDKQTPAMECVSECLVDEVSTAGAGRRRDDDKDGNEGSVDDVLARAIATNNSRQNADSREIGKRPSKVLHH